MATERILNHADAEQIATKIETLADVTPGTNDGDNGKLPSHADGTRIVEALENFIKNRKNGHAIVDEDGTSYPSRANLKITNANITDDSDNDTTIVEITGGGGTTIVQIPTISVETYTYDGTEQGPAITGLDAEHCTVTNATKTDAGTYTLTIALNNTNTMVWSDLTNQPKTFEYTIQKATVTVPTVSATSKTYNGSAQHPTVTGYDDTKMTRTGYEYTNAGSYTLSFSLLDPDNYQWSSSTTSFAWTIVAKSIAIPTVSGSFTYDGSSKAATIGNTGDSAYYTQGGTASATDAGTYTVTFTLKDSTNTKWSDDSTAQKSGTWTIAKADQTIQLSKSTVALDAAKLYDTVNITLTGAGSLSVLSNNTSVATATLSGNSVQINAVDSGSTTVTVTAGGTNNYNAKTASISVTVTLAKELDETSWEDISTAAQNGTASSLWDVGDCKSVLVNGTVGTLAINQTLYVYILGFNHNSSVEGTGIQFACSKTAKENGIDVALCDSTYNSYKSDGTKAFNMNHWGGSSNPYNTNYGGWKGCDARYDILGSTKQAPSGYGSTPTTSRVGYDAASDTATSPVANTLMAALPSALRSVMKPITKYTDNTGNSSTAAANVTSSVDYLPLLAEYEVHGANTYANTNEAPKQAQYKYFENGNSKIKYRHSSAASAVTWWCRSPRSSSANSFCLASTSGAASNYSSRDSDGLAPAFRV